MKVAVSAVSALFFLCFASSAALAQYDAPDPEIEEWVASCLETEGLNFLPDTDVLCYNAAIFPEQFLQLRDLPEASRIIITSPGGNVATARVMSTILDQRGEPAIIAGPCMSACAMVLLPGLDSIHIHHTAHIAVHGITMMDFRIWWGWLREDRVPSGMAVMAAQLGYDFNFALHHSGKSHMEDHLNGQNVDLGYIQVISDQMQADALAYDCRVDPKDYWGMLDAEHLRAFLGSRIERMEAFAQSWSDPNNQFYKSITEPIGDRTYIFKDDLFEADCLQD